MEYFTAIILCISHNNSIDYYCWLDFTSEEKL